MLYNRNKVSISFSSLDIRVKEIALAVTVRRTQHSGTPRNKKLRALHDQIMSISILRYSFLDVATGRLNTERRKDLNRTLYYQPQENFPVYYYLLLISSYQASKESTQFWVIHFRKINDKSKTLRELIICRSFSKDAKLSLISMILNFLLSSKILQVNIPVKQYVKSEYHHLRYFKSLWH